MYKTLNIIIGGEQKHQSIKTDGICTCLCSAMGTGGGYVPMIVEEKEMAELINFCVDKNAPDGSFGKADNARAVDIRTPVARTITCKEPGFSVHHSNLCIVAMRGRENGQRLEPNTTGTTNTLTTVQKDNLVLEKKIKKVGQKDGISPTITTRPEGKKTAILPVTQQYRIRKLTPKEYWRLMGFKDEDFEKAAYEKKELYIQGGNDPCNARLKTVAEKPTLTDMETYVSCTTNDMLNMETLKTIKKLLAEKPESEKTQRVNFVITKSADLEHSDSATNTTKCITYMGMQCTLTEDKDRHQMVIIAQAKKDKQNTGKSMKITTESNLNPLKLYIILILTELIMKSGIYGSTTLQANIKGNTQIIDDSENSILLKISNLKMESISTRVSPSQLYKQAGNSIVKQVLMALFSQMNIKGVKKWNE